MSSVPIHDVPDRFDAVAGALLEAARKWADRAGDATTTDYARASLKLADDMSKIAQRLQTLAAGWRPQIGQVPITPDYSNPLKGGGSSSSSPEAQRRAAEMQRTAR